jgi:hypothetical protein
MVSKPLAAVAIAFALLAVPVVPELTLSGSLVVDHAH